MANGVVSFTQNFSRKTATLLCRSIGRKVVLRIRILICCLKSMGYRKLSLLVCA